jgi:hypothetical protein
MNVSLKIILFCVIILIIVVEENIYCMLVSVRVELGHQIPYLRYVLQLKYFVD